MQDSMTAASAYESKAGVPAPGSSGHAVCRRPVEPGFGAVALTCGGWFRSVQRLRHVAAGEPPFPERGVDPRKGVNG